MFQGRGKEFVGCLLYTSDAADERSRVDLGGRRIIKKKKRDAERTAKRGLTREERSTSATTRPLNGRSMNNEYQTAANSTATRGVPRRSVRASAAGRSPS